METGNCLVGPTTSKGDGLEYPRLDEPAIATQSWVGCSQPLSPASPHGDVGPPLARPSCRFHIRAKFVLHLVRAAPWKNICQPLDAPLSLVSCRKGIGRPDHFAVSVFIAFFLCPPHHSTASFILFDAINEGQFSR